MESKGGFREYISTISPLLKVESTLVNAANELYSNGLITRDTHTDVTTQHNQPTRQRVSSLIAAVNATLATFPEKEQSVLQILDTNNDKVYPFHDQTSELSDFDDEQVPLLSNTQDSSNNSEQTSEMVHTAVTSTHQQLDFWTQLSINDKLKYIGSMFVLLIFLYMIQFDISTSNCCNSAWFVTKMDEQITSYSHYNRFLPLVMIYFYILSTVMINDKVDKWKDMVLIYIAFQVSKYFSFLLWYDHFFRVLSYGLALMAMLFDFSMTVDHSLFQRNNSFIITAVLMNWRRLQLSVDLFGIFMNIIPQQYYNVLEVSFLGGLQNFSILIDLIIGHLSKRLNISEVVLELTVMFPLIILIRSFIYYSVGHTLSAILFYTITISGFTTFAIVLLVRLKYIRSGLNAANQTMEATQGTTLNVALQHRKTFIKLWKWILIITFIIELYYNITDYGKESVFTKPIGIVMLIVIIISLGCILCYTLSFVAIFIVCCITGPSFLILFVYTVYHSHGLYFSIPYIQCYILALHIYFTCV